MLASAVISQRGVAEVAGRCNMGRDLPEIVGIIMKNTWLSEAYGGVENERTLSQGS